nr:TPA_asm: m44.6 sORF 1 [Murid betaherpesvirus 1]DBA07772.1 TPA_asm: m44.6 sORF 1 [Murid betaherpesvirus 1]
MHRSTLARTAV